jgi:hypothetical protein
VTKLTPNESFSTKVLDTGNQPENSLQLKVHMRTWSTASTSASRNIRIILTQTLRPPTKPFQTSPKPPAATCSPTFCNPERAKQRGWSPDLRERRSRALNISGLTIEKDSRSRNCVLFFNHHCIHCIDNPNHLHLVGGPEGLAHLSPDMQKTDWMTPHLEGEEPA